MTKQHFASNNKSSNKHNSSDEFEYKKSTRKRSPKRKSHSKQYDDDIKFNKWQ